MLPTACHQTHRPRPAGHKTRWYQIQAVQLMTVLTICESWNFSLHNHEALHVADVVLMYGIPEFVCPKDIVLYEVEGLKEGWCGHPRLT